ncbi:MAG: hypothetical protein ACR2MF_03235 [Chthoniobacterales bacterium]
MIKKCLVAFAATGLAAVVFTSCNTPAGQGAAVGAGTGAIVGGPVGAAVGAGAVALIGSAVAADRVAEYGPMPASGYPMAMPTATAGMYRSPYTQRMYDLRAVPHRGLVRDTEVNKLFRKP